MLDNIDSSKKKKYGSIAVLILVLIASLFIGFFFTQDAPDVDFSEAPNCEDVTYSGTGSIDNPYEVSNIHELQCMGEEDSIGIYKLTNDINGSYTEEWNDGKGFRPTDGEAVTLLGDGHTIRNIYSYQRLDDINDYRYLFYANVSNVELKGTDIDTNYNPDNSEAPTCEFEEYEYDGDGSYQNPYEVSDIHELQCISHNPNAHYQLTDDIDAEGTEEWNDGKGFKPIGGFSGSLNGDGHTVRDLYINRTGESDIGLISISSGDITNVGVTGTISGYSRVGGVVGWLQGDGVVNSVYFDGDIEGKNDEIGGLIGRIGDSNRIGYSDPKVTNTYVKGNVRGTEKVGGLAGTYESGDITNSYVTANVEGDNQVKGLFSQSAEGTLKNLYRNNQEHENIPLGVYTDSPSILYLDTAEMQGDSAKENMNGFDFEDTWKTVEDDYPHLQWE